MPYIRKTKIEYHIHKYHNNVWEQVDCADSFPEARELIKLYRESEKTAFKIVHKRVKLQIV